MLCRVSAFCALLTFILPFVTAHRARQHHQEVALRARGSVDIYKRQSFSNTRFTFYDVGLGACGQTNVASDWIVAINIEQFGDGYPGPACFKSITLQYGGKTAQATIMDRCQVCPYAGLDLSRGLFDFFAPESEGVLYGAWWFDDGPSPSPTPPSSTWNPPTTTSTPAYTPPAPSTSSTPTYTSPPPTTSSTSLPSTTTTTTTSISSATFSTGSTSVSALPSAGSTPGPSHPDNIAVALEVLVSYARLVSLAETE